MQNTRKQIIQNDQGFVFDNKVSGEINNLVQNHSQIEMRLKAFNRNYELSSLEMREASTKVVEKTTALDREQRLMANREQVDMIRRSIADGLTSEIGTEKSRRIANQFTKDAMEKNIKRASENLVKNFEEANKRLSGVKLDTFSKPKAANAPKHDKAAMIRQMMLSNQKAQIQRNNSNSSRQSSQEGSEFSRSVTKFSKIMHMRNMTLRQMRRNARDLKMSVSKMLDISNADNGIAFDQFGLENAHFAQDQIRKILEIVHTGENAVTRTTARAKDMNIDSLLQRGRASMMQVSSRSRNLQRHLVRQRQREQERVRC